MTTSWPIIWICPRFLRTSKCSCLLGRSLITLEKTCFKHRHLGLLRLFQTLSFLIIHRIGFIYSFTLNRTLGWSYFLETYINFFDTLLCFSYLFVKTIQEFIIIDLRTSSGSTWFFDSRLLIQIRGLQLRIMLNLVLNYELSIFLFLFEYFLIDKILIPLKNILCLIIKYSLRRLRLEIFHFIFFYDRWIRCTVALICIFQFIQHISTISWSLFSILKLKLWCVTFWIAVRILKKSLFRRRF